MEDADLPSPGGDTSLSVEQAASAYAKTLTPNAADPGQAEDDETEQGTKTEDELQASDEDVGDEADGEAEDEGQAEDEDEDEPESDQGRYVAKNGKVKLEDGSTVTVDDLIKGNLRDRDYRQKTMEAAEVRKTFEAQSSGLKERETQLAEQAEYFSTLIQSIIPPAPDPAMADPSSDKFDLVAYNHQRATREQWMEHLQYLNGEQQKRKSAEAEETVKGKKERADKEWEALLGKVPEFRDEKRVEAFVKQSFSIGEAYGFTKAEMADELAMDHRKVLVFKDAADWRKLQASKPNVQKKVEGRPAVQKGGKRLNPAEHRARNGNEALARLKQSGSVEDATAAYIASLNKG